MDPSTGGFLRVHGTGSLDTIDSRTAYELSLKGMEPYCDVSLFRVPVIWTVPIHTISEGLATANAVHGSSLAAAAQQPRGLLGKIKDERAYGPHSVTPALSESTTESEWGYENQDHGGVAVSPYLGVHGHTWDQLWRYVSNRYDAAPDQVVSNYGFIVVKANFVTGVIGSTLLQSPTGSLIRKEILKYKAEDFKGVNGSLTGDGTGYWEVDYGATLYLKAGGQESRVTTSQVGAYAFGRLGMSIQGIWSYAQGGVMRSNDPSEFVSDYCSTMTLSADGTFTDETAIGKMSGGTYSEIRPNEWDVSRFKGGGVNCEADVYLRKAISLTGRRRISDLDLKLQYKSYGWLLTVNNGTSTNTFALAEVQHEKLWYTYRARTHVVTEYYDANGNLSSTVNEPAWTYSQYLESELEQEISWEGNPATKVVRYYVREKYAEYKTDGLWKVEIRAFDTTEPQLPPQRIHLYEFK